MSILQNLFQGRRHSKRHGVCSYRTAIEQLEDRCMLAAHAFFPTVDSETSPAADLTPPTIPALPLTSQSAGTTTRIPMTTRIPIAPDASAEGEADGQPTPQPIILLPGILGSMPRQNLADWLAFDDQAMAPDNLEVDPIMRSYDDLLASLVAAGYNDGSQPGMQTLWAAPYDWRLPVAPRDGVIDGQIDTQLLDPTDSTWEYGVEYVHYWIEQARAEWADSGLDPDQFAVDVVAHSMGGLLARSYLQSDLYEPGEIDQFLMLGTPNHGAVDAYQVREWVNDALALAPEAALDRLADGLAETGSSEAFTASLLAAGAKLLDSPSLESYSPSITDLLPTFDFISTLVPHKWLQGIDDNTLLADLNSDYDYSALDVTAQTLSGTGLETNYELYHPLGFDLKNLLAYDKLPDGDGDSTVLAASARLDGVAEQTIENVGHVELAGADTRAQQRVFEFLGIVAPTNGYSSGAYRALADGLANWLGTVIDYPWHNAVKPLDVNADGNISPIDALHVITTLNAQGSRQLPLSSVRAMVAPYFDVNGDGFVSPIDVLQVIHALNGSTSGSSGNDGEGEGEGKDSQVAAPGFGAGLAGVHTVVSAASQAPNEQSAIVDTPLGMTLSAIPTGLPLPLHDPLEQVLHDAQWTNQQLDEYLDDLVEDIADRWDHPFARLW